MAASETFKEETLWSGEEEETSSLCPARDSGYRQPWSAVQKQARSNWVAASLFQLILVSMTVCALVLGALFASGLVAVTTGPKECALRTDNLGFLPSSDKLQSEEYLPGSQAWIHSPYAGAPSESKGLAWDKLQQVRGLKLSKQEAGIVRLPSGLVLEDEHQATILGVMHNLHCLRMIRQYLYPEYYYADLDKIALLKMRNHSDHCIETLRESVMCLPDLTPHALEWADEEERVHVNLNSVARRQCVKWESLVGWQRKREFHLDDLWEANPRIL